jgi:hypothetical protein
MTHLVVRGDDPMIHLVVGDQLKALEIESRRFGPVVSGVCREMIHLVVGGG